MFKPAVGEQMQEVGAVALTLSILSMIQVAMIVDWGWCMQACITLAISNLS